MAVKNISADDAKKLLDEGKALLLDVREVDEYKAERIKGAVNLPLSSLNSDEVRKIVGHKTLIIQCLMGGRATKACIQLDISLADIDKYVLEGGIGGWKKLNLPTITKMAGLNIMRQTQLVAGSFIFSGSLLALYVNINYIALPLFFGAGLMFAGGFGWCGMAKLLRKMPWNK